jgi:PAS domain S-box-containing protein
MDRIVYEKIVDDNCYISKTDINGTITFVNENYCKISAYNEDELIGQTHSKIRSTETDEKIYKDIWQTILSGKVWKGILKILINLEENFLWIHQYILFLIMMEILKSLYHLVMT